MQKYMRYSLLILFFYCLLVKINFAQSDTLYLSLTDALAMARVKSPATQEAKINNRSGLLSLATSISQILPTPTASASYSKTKSNPGLPTTLTNKTFSGSVGLNQVIFDPDVYSNLYKGKLYYDYYHLQAKDIQANLIYSVKVSYFNLAKSYNLFDASQSALKRAEDNYVLAQEKFRLGQITRFDLLRSETFKTQARLDLLTAEKNLKTSLEDLKGQLGIFNNSVIKPISTPDLPELEINFENLFTNILTKNTTLLTSKKYQSISKTSFLQSITKLLPTANLFWQSSYSDTLIPKNITDWKNQDAISYGIKFNFPIFEIKSYLLNIGSSRNELRRANVQLKKTEILLRKNATNAILTFQQTKEQYQYALQNLELNKELLRLAQEQYRLGAISQLDLFNTEINYNTAQNTYYSALYDAYTSYAQIEYLLGIIDSNLK